MQPINFIKNNTTAQHTALRIWFRISVLLIGSTLISVASMQLFIGIQTRSLTHEMQLIARDKQKANTVAQAIHEQKKHNDLLTAQLNTLGQIKCYADLLKSIKGSLASGQQLLYICLHDNQIEMKVTGLTTASIVKITQNLTQKKMAQNLAIISFDKADAAFCALVKGTLTS